MKCEGRKSACYGCPFRHNFEALPDVMEIITLNIECCGFSLLPTSLDQGGREAIQDVPIESSREIVVNDGAIWHVRMIPRCLTAHERSTMPMMEIVTLFIKDTSGATVEVKNNFNSPATRQFETEVQGRKRRVEVVNETTDSQCGTTIAAATLID